MLHSTECIYERLLGKSGCRLKEDENNKKNKKIFMKTKNLIYWSCGGA